MRSSSRRSGRGSRASASSRSTRARPHAGRAVRILSPRNGAPDRPERHAEGAARPRAELARHHQRRDQFPAERRLRDLLRARNPCARAELRFRQAGRRDGARNGDRPLPRRDGGRPRHAQGGREMAARRRGRVLLALWRAGRPDRLRRSRARLRSAARAVRLPGQGLRSVDFRSFHGRLRRRRRVARGGVERRARSSSCSPP